MAQQVKVIFSNEVLANAKEIDDYLQDNYSLRAAQSFHLQILGYKADPKKLKY